MSAIQTVAKVAVRMRKRRVAKWPGGRDPERWRRYMKAYMRKYRAKK